MRNTMALIHILVLTKLKSIESFKQTTTQRLTVTDQNTISNKPDDTVFVIRSIATLVAATTCCESGLQILSKEAGL